MSYLNSIKRLKTVINTLLSKLGLIEATWAESWAMSGI